MPLPEPLAGKWNIASEKNLDKILKEIEKEQKRAGKLNLVVCDPSSSRTLKTEPGDSPGGGNMSNYDDLSPSFIKRKKKISTLQDCGDQRKSATERIVEDKKPRKKKSNKIKQNKTKSEKRQEKGREKTQKPPLSSRSLGANEYSSSPKVSKKVSSSCRSLATDRSKRAQNEDLMTQPGSLAAIRSSARVKSKACSEETICSMPKQQKQKKRASQTRTRMGSRKEDYKNTGNEVDPKETGKQNKAASKSNKGPTLDSWGIGHAQRKLRRGMDDDRTYDTGCISTFTGFTENSDLIKEARVIHHGSSCSVGSESLYTDGEELFDFEDTFSEYSYETMDSDL